MGTSSRLRSDRDDVTSLPKRIPGAHLCQPHAAPEGGWFGEPVEWPTKDPDGTAANTVDTAVACYLGITELPAGAEAETLFRRVIDGLHRITPDTASGLEQP